MENHFTSVNGAEQFTELIKRSEAQPIVIFKHSSSCGVSAAAYEEMQQFSGEVILVVVQQARELSREIERQTGVRHESPQVLVLDNGKVVWSASHFKINAQSVAEALMAAGKQQV